MINAIRIKKLGLLGATVAMAATTVLPTTAADAQRYRNDRHGQGYYGREYRGNDGRVEYRQQRRCSDGTTGAIVGAIAGGLLGRVIDSRGDRATGTLLGAGGGALAGRAIDRNGARDAEYQGRCYR